MRRTALLITLAGLLAACADPTTGGTTEGANASASNSGSGSATLGSGSDTGATGLTNAGSSGGSSDCVPNGLNVDGNASLCCSGAVDADGKCAPASASAGDSGSTTTSTTGGPTTATTSAGTTATTSDGTTSAGTTSATTGVGFGGGTTSSSCYPDGSYVGVGNEAACCSEAVDASGYCVDPNVTTTTTGGTTTSGTTTDGTTTGPTGTTTTGTTTTGTTTGGTTTGGTCSASCYSARGYHCENGQCVLNGGDGQLQFTLQWDTTLQTNNQRAREDLDLHVVEPLPDGGLGPEIYYGNPNPPRAVGWLDLDQNAGCGQTDNQGGFGNDTENVIYPSDGGARHGTYKIIVDDYEDQCDGTSPNPFFWKLTIRNGAQTTVYDGQFSQANPDNADGASTLKSAISTNGHKVYTFTY